MVLSTRNAGKYLTKTHLTDLAEASADRRDFTADELAILEVPDDRGHVKPDELETVPLDPKTPRRKIRVIDMPLFRGDD